MPWIESHQELRNHPKTKRLARELRISVAAAIGHLHCLWWWATDYAPDGDLTEYEDWEIADAAYYEGKNIEKFKDALIFAGFLDNTEGRLLLHDWNDYGGKNVQQRQKAREKTQRYRDRQNARMQAAQNGNETPQAHPPSEKTDVTKTECNGNVTVTQPTRNRNDTENVPEPYPSTGQDSTGHNITGHYSTEHESTDTPLNPPEGGDAEKPDLQERRFEEFWAAYPKKQGKGAARKAWMKIRPNTETFKTIMESVKAHAANNPQWLKDNGQYIPNPATWLNQTRWEDEKPKAIQTNGGGQGDGGTADTGSAFRRSTGFRSADNDANPDG